LSLLIAYLLDPLVDVLEAKGINRTLGICIFIGIGLLGMGLFVLFLYPTISKQASLIWERLPQLAGIIETRLFPWLESNGVEIPATISEALSEHGNTVKDALPALVEKASGLTAGLAAKTGPIIASLLYLVMIPIFTFYFLRDFDLMKPALLDLIPMHKREFIVERLHRADEVVGAWFRGQVEVALILAVLYAIGLGVVFGVAGVGATSGIAIGLLTGILNIIPYFGVFIGVVLSTLIVLLDWHGIGPLIGVGVVFAVVQLLEGYVITPRVVGEKVGLSPVTVIIVLLLGGEVMGLLGVLLAIPIAGVIRVLLPDILDYYKSSPYYTGTLLYELHGNGNTNEPKTSEEPLVASSPETPEEEANEGDDPKSEDEKESEKPESDQEKSS
jgi:predicted PurR-regulated permease PerM